MASRDFGISLVLCTTLSTLVGPGCGRRAGPTTTPGSDDGGPEEVDPAQAAKAARIRSSTSTRGAKLDIKRIRAKKPPASSDKKKTHTPNETPGEVPVLDGMVPTVVSVGSRLEVFGAHLDREDLQVRVGDKPQKIVEQTEDRVVVSIAAGDSGPLSLGTVHDDEYTEAARSEGTVFVLANDAAFGRRRLQVDQGLIGDVYAIPGEVDELPAFDDLGPPIATIAVDRLNISPGKLTQAVAGRDEWFAVHFQGSLNVLEEDEYEICLEAGRGALLYLDGTEVVDNDGSHDPKEECVLVDMGAGEYQVDLLWYQGVGDMALQLSWAKGGGKKRLVGSNDLFPPQSVDAFLRG